MATHDERSADRRPAAHATKASTLNKRIEDMEERLALERVQAVAHVREFGGNVRRRLTSPTSLAFSTSIGFVAAEILESRRRIAREARRRGRVKKPGKSLLASIVEPLVPLARIGVLGFFAKKNKDMVEQVEGSTEGAAYTLH